MTIVAHSRPFIVGVDAHAKSHTLSILVAATGELVDVQQFHASEAAMARAVAWVARRTGGDLAVLWVIEGVGSYGARLASIVVDVGYEVVEAPRMNARGNRGVGKSDPLDAHRIAAAVLPLDSDQLRRPRRDDGVPAAVRVLLVARDSMTTERTGHINSLTALVRAADLGVDARRPLTTAQIAEISRWRPRGEDIGLATARAEAVRVAKRIAALDDEIAANTANTTALLKQSPARVLIKKTGIGPVTAAVVLAAWSYPGRLRNEAAFASLAGVNPIPASSGNTVRHRLNRGGDRRVNQALHMAVITRMAHHAETRAYVDKRLADGLTKREIRRLLKRYLSRQIYRALEAAAREITSMTDVTTRPA